MSSYSSYYLYEKYEKRGNGNWIPSYPNTFSVDGDGTMTVVEKSSADTACGYIPSGQTQYRWVNMNISTDWICDECPTPTFDGKWLATYTGGTTSSASCDASSAITEGEITTDNLVNVEIGNCVTSIGNYALYNCRSITSCTIGSGVTSINTGAFMYSSGLTSINIPDSVTSIGGAAFEFCKALTSCTIGSGVTTIGKKAFNTYSRLTSIICYAFTPPTLSGSGVFDYTNSCDTTTDGTAC